MTQAIFGRRGPAPQGAVCRPAAPAWTPEPETELSTEILFDNSERFLGSLPLITVGTILLLWVIFALETHFAFDVGKGGVLSTLSLTALGAASRDLVISQHQAWRLFLAPLLHNGVSHIFGNSLALALLGYFLEIRVGRGWFLAVFFVSALAGGLGSMIGNPPGIVTVGASGAITGLLGAVFMLSFHSAFDAQQNKAMRRMALRWAVPALGPLLWGAQGHTDYSAHLGGALGGASIGFFLLANWDGQSYRPAHSKPMSLVAALFLCGSTVGVAFAALDYRQRQHEAGQFIPLARIPENLVTDGAQALEFLRLYPTDPRSHFIAARAALKDKNGFAAEHELKRAIVLANEPETKPVQLAAKALLAAIYTDRHDWRQAAENAGEICDGSSKEPNADALRKLLVKAKVCN